MTSRDQTRRDAAPQVGERRYAIAAVAERSGVRVETVLRYEEYGLLEPVPGEGSARFYTDEDVDRVLRVRRLVNDLGVNLAGAAAILHLRQQLIAAQRELRLLREESERH